MTALAAEEAGAASSATAARGAGSQASAGGRNALGNTQQQRVAELQGRRDKAARRAENARVWKQIQAEGGGKAPAKPAPEPAPKGDQGPAEQAVPGRGLAKEGLQNAVPGSRFAGQAVGSVVNSGPAQAGGGFVLGLMGWALALAYLRGGPGEVRKLLRAKFLNEVG